ncbi:MAG: type IV secretion system protein TraC [Rhabdochlamydiaceae bacterium]|nr:type IV secretion system protein TraC [Candidatus Amphrikana amoebophyrae]
MGTLSRIGQKFLEFFNEDSPADMLAFENQNASYVLENDFLSDLLPYQFYDEQRKLFENETSCGFVLELPPVLGSNDQMQEEISTLVREIGEEGASIQCLMWSDPRIDPFLEKWKSPRLQKGGFFEKIGQRKKEFFHKQSESGEVQPRIFRFFFSYSLPKDKGSLMEGILNRLEEKRKKAISTLSHFASVGQVGAQEFLEVFSGFLSSNQGPEVNQRKTWNEESPLSKQLLLPTGSVNVCKDGLIFSGNDELCLRTYEAVDFPDSWSMNMNHELLGDFLNSAYRFSSPFFIHYGIFFPEQEKLETKLKSKAKLIDHQCKFPSIIKMFPDLPKEREEYDFVSRNLLEGELFVETRLSVGLWGEKNSFMKQESTLLSLYQKHGIKLKPNLYNHLNDLIASLPMVWGENAKYMADYKRRSLLKTTLTKETGNFIPILGEWWGNSQKAMPLIGRRGQICSWDPFAGEGNLNAVVIGPSGSGKSVFMQEMIMSELGQGGRIFVLDLGRSFEKLCHLVEGQHLFFTHKSCLNLNPFNLIKSDGNLESINTSLEMVSSIIATMAMPHQKIDKDRADLLSSVVKKAWDQKGSKATVDDVIRLIGEASFNSELMKGVAESLYGGLQKFSCNGVYRDYFYGDQEVNFNSDLVVIETEELKNMADLQAVILQIFALTISNQVFMGDREKRSMICIDEAWDLLKSPQMEGFIESMARRLRKYNGALVVGTQGLKDFERSPGAKAAFQNSNWLLMLGKDNDSLNILKRDNLIPMDDYKERMLNSLRKEDGKYSEVFIYHKGTGFFTLCQLKLDPFSGMLYSTNALEFQAIQELQKEGFSIDEAIDWMVENKKKLNYLTENGKRISQALEILLGKYQNLEEIHG